MLEWSEAKLGDIAETTSGGTPNRKNDAFFGGSIPWVKSGELEIPSFATLKRNLPQKD